jgi:hypothetical protein
MTRSSLRDHILWSRCFSPDQRLGCHRGFILSGVVCVKLETTDLETRRGGRPILRAEEHSPKNGARFLLPSMLSEFSSNRELWSSESIQTVAALKCLNERAEAAFGTRRRRSLNRRGYRGLG